MARRAGSAFNRHDKAAIRASIEVAMEMGHARCFVEYGGLRMRFDLDGGVGAGSAADEVIRVGGDGTVGQLPRKSFPGRRAYLRHVSTPVPGPFFVLSKTLSPTTTTLLPWRC